MKETNLLSEFYFNEQMDYENHNWGTVTSSHFEEDEAIIKRASIISESRDVSFCFKPCIDLMSATRAIPPGVTLTLEFERSTPEFSLLAADSMQKYKI